MKNKTVRNKATWHELGDGNPRAWWCQEYDGWSCDDQELNIWRRGCAKVSLKAINGIFQCNDGTYMTDMTPSGTHASLEAAQDAVIRGLAAELVD